MQLTGFEKIIFVVSLVLNANFLLFALFLFLKKAVNHYANKILACGLVVLVIINTLLSLYNTSFYYHFPQFVSVHLPFLFVLVLPLYFYYKAILKHDFKFEKSHLLHFILPFIIFIYTYFRQYSKPVAFKIDFLQYHLYDRHYFFSLLVYLQVLFYVILIYLEYRQLNIKLNPESADDCKFR